jgi:ribosomal protein S18 acetylase RimI-like enzyme
VAIIMAVNGGDEQGWRSMFRRATAAEDQALLVAEVEGEIAGYARVSHREELGDGARRTPAGYYLTGLVVADQWRRRGLAEALTMARLAWAWARTDKVWYFASADNSPSLALHQRLGFREVTRDFEHSGVDFAGGVGVLSVCDRPAALNG